MQSPATLPIDTLDSGTTIVVDPPSEKAGLVMGLRELLADTFVVFSKTLGFHWNVEGPRFRSLHAMFEEHYTQLLQDIDVIAERLRALGDYAPGSLQQLKRLATVREQNDVPDAEAMVSELLRDHRSLSKTAVTVHEIAGRHGDQVTADLMIERARYHDEVAWMLNALLQ